MRFNTKGRAAFAVLILAIACMADGEREQGMPSLRVRGESKVTDAHTNAPTHGVFMDSSHPFITDAALAEKAKLAVSVHTEEKARFDAVYGLAISGYTEESTRALAKVAGDKSASVTMRGYAAMGLRNFTRSIPPELKRETQEMLQSNMTTEGYDTPDGIMRTLIAWGDAAFIFKTLGDEAKGHPMEMEILDGLPSDQGVDRLLQLYEGCRMGYRSYNKRAEIGRALVKKQDKRGVDILMKLLPAEGSPSGQNRHNVFNFLQKYVAKDSNFGYDALNYHSSLDDAVPKMLAWWEESREDFVFGGSRKKQ